MNIDRSISLIVADHREIVRSGLRFIFEDDDRFDLIEETDNGEDAIELVDYFHPDLVLLDSSVPRIGGFEAGKIIKSEHPDIKVVVFSPESGDYDLDLQVECADGLLPKSISSYVLTEALYRIVRGEKLFCSQSDCSCLKSIDLDVILK